MGSKLEQMQLQNWTGPGVRRSREYGFQTVLYRSWDDIEYVQVILIKQQL